MSWRPCWRKANKTISLAAIVFGACFPQTWPPCPSLVNLKRLIENHQLHNTLLTKLFQWITVDFTSFLSLGLRWRSHQSKFVDSIHATDSCEKSQSTLCRKSLVFSGCSGFLPRGKLTGWVRINTVKKVIYQNCYEDKIVFWLSM
jgi:hypothetical protein